MDRLGTLTIVVAAAILASVLFVPPVIGLANNGDYGKVSLHYALFSPNEEEFNFAPQTHKFLPEKQWAAAFSPPPTSPSKPLSSSTASPARKISIAASSPPSIAPSSSSP